MRHLYRYAAVLFAGALFFAGASAASAATLFLSPPTVTAGPSQSFTIDVKVDSAGVGFNAAQATIRFPKDLLQVSSLSRTDSSFSFWLEEPHFSNDQGVISFIGGSPYGVSGAAIQVIRITFAPKGTGTGAITVTDAAITASDGSGTNILSTTTNASVTVSPNVAAAGGSETAPTQITRTPAGATGTAKAPALTVPLYPDPTEWYDQVSPFTASWTLPSDVSAVATALNKQPNFDPTASEGLFDNKTFGALSAEGTWYLHVRFKNALGWGVTEHYRIAVDTQPPPGFKLDLLDGTTTGNPTPKLAFKTDDALSGLKEYRIRIDSNDPIIIPAKGYMGTYALPAQPPGDHRVLVQAVDNAGNSVEDFASFNILPIASPAFTFTTNQIFTDEERGLTVRGTALPDAAIILNVHRGGAIVASTTVRADAEGNWSYTFEEPLRNGTYGVSAVARDARGALSLAVESSPVAVSERPIIQLGVLQLGAGGAVILLLLILAAGWGGGLYYYRREQETLLRRLLVAETDVAKVFKIISDDVEKLRKLGNLSSDSSLVLNRLHENLEKMEGYLKKELQNIKK